MMPWLQCHVSANGHKCNRSMELLRKFLGFETLGPQCGALESGRTLEIVPSLWK